MGDFPGFPSMEAQVAPPLNGGWLKLFFAASVCNAAGLVLHLAVVAAGQDTDLH